jgi:hypothetical protein
MTVTRYLTEPFVGDKLHLRQSLYSSVVTERFSGNSMHGGS